MTFWIFGSVAVLGAGVAVVSKDFSKVVLSLWITGIATGCVFQSLGAEVLAVLQWVAATLVALALLVFSLLFGEAKNAQTSGKFTREAIVAAIRAGKWVPASAAVLAGLGFALVLVLASPEVSLHAGGQVAAEAGNDLAAVGAHVADHHMLSFEVLAFALLAAVVGGGAVARPDASVGSAAGEES